MNLVNYYRFYDSSDLELLYKELESKRSIKHKVGFYYLDRNECFCYTKSQNDNLLKILSNYDDLLFENLQYYQGNEHEISFKVSKLKQPLIHWCPIPVLSEKDSFVIFEEVCGLTTNYNICILNKWKYLFDTQILGLKWLRTINNYDVFKIENQIEDDVKINNKIISLDDAHACMSDIFKLNNGAIIISIRLALFLKDFWKGDMDVRFQPIISNNISNAKKKIYCRQLEKKIDRNSINDINIVEKFYNIKFPADYKLWLNDNVENLPEGWLSPKGGKNSEIVSTTKFEMENSEPPLPKDLITICSIGNGDYICLKISKKKKIKFIYWSHDDKKVSNIVMDNGFNSWLQDFFL